MKQEDGRKSTVQCRTSSSGQSSSRLRRVDMEIRGSCTPTQGWNLSELTLGSASNASGDRLLWDQITSPNEV